MFSLICCTMTANRIFTGFLFLIVVLGGVAAIPDARILGGDDTPSGKYPWVASIRVDSVHTCSGSIINHYYIITAARCVSSIDNSRLSARVGSINKFAGGELKTVESVFIHPSFGNFLHDIALLKVGTPFNFADKINKIALASSNENVEDDTPVFVTGWGRQEIDASSSSHKLHHLFMSVLNSEECERQAGYGYNSVICLNHLAGSGICQGDEGAGVVSERKLVAVASFYFGNCGTKYPDVASKISYYDLWIKSVIENN